MHAPNHQVQLNYENLRSYPPPDKDELGNSSSVQARQIFQEVKQLLERESRLASLETFQRSIFT